MTLMTLASMSVASDQHRVQAWAGSTLVHGLCIGIAMLLLTDLKIGAQSDPLKLDIALIQPPPSPPPVLKNPKPKKLPKVVPVKQTMTEPQPVVEQKIAQPQPHKQEIQKIDPVQESEPVKQVEPTTTAKPVAKPVRETVEVQSASMPVPMPSPQQTRKSVEAKPMVAARVSHKKMAPVRPHKHPVPFKKIFAQSAHARPDAKPNRVERQKKGTPVTETQQKVTSVRRREIRTAIIPEPAITAKPIPTEQPSTTTNSLKTPKPMKAAKPIPSAQPVITALPQEAFSEVVSEPAPASRTDPTIMRQPIQPKREIVESKKPVTKKRLPVVGRPEPKIRQPVASVTRSVQAYPSTQADFGWLAQAIWDRMERIKRYPREARQKEWEGKVVLEAVIRQDGEILTVRIAESSGYTLLDQNAMDVMLEISPLPLKHALGRSQVTILVPLNYRLEE